VKKILIFLTYLFLYLNQLYAGVPTAQFLLVGQGARETAMGQAAVANCYNYSAPYWNPGASAFLKNPTLGFSFAQLPEEIGSSYASFIYPFRKFAVGLYSISEITSVTTYDIYGNIGPDTQVSNINSAFNFAYKIFDSLAIGLNLGSIRMNLGNYSATAQSNSIGFIFFKNRLSLGLTSANIGGDITFVDTPEKQPKLIRLGLAYYFLEKRNLTVAFSTEEVQDDENAGIRGLGIEYYPLKNIGLRLGLKNTNDGIPTITAGLGLNLKRWVLDYAFNSQGQELPNMDIHRIGLSVRFGKIEGEEEEPEIETYKPTKTRLVKPKRKSGEIINIAVSDFSGKNVSQADASIVADFLRTELVNTGIYNVIEKANMEKVLAEAAFQQSGCTTSECAVQIGKILNVKQIVVGNLSKLMDTYYITVNVVDVETSKIVASYDQEAMSAKELKTACGLLAQRLAQ